jgi:putative tryptophan/tyrosine transport system substrate-binding protein
VIARRTLSALVAAWPITRARVQAAEPPPRRIGVLCPDVSDGTGPLWDMFVEELARRGHVEGRQVSFVKRCGREDSVELLAKAAAELVALKVDLIYAARGTASALAAKNATKSIPVVFFSSADPVGLGVVESLARPGGNLTGSAVPVFDTVRKGIELLAEMVPGLRQFAFFRPPGTQSLPWMRRTEEVLRAAAQRLALQARFVDVEWVQQMPALIAEAARQGPTAMVLFDFPMFRPELQRIASVCIEHRQPSYGSTYAGFLLDYGEPRYDVARTAAAYVDRILRGARPADLPVEQVSTYHLIINLRTARAIGLKVPPAVLLRATEVLE